MQALKRRFVPRWGGQKAPAARWWLRGLLVAGLLLARPAAAQPLSLLRAAGPKMVNAAGQEVVLRGFNVGGWLLQESYMLGTDTLNCQWRIQQGLLRTMPEAELEDFYRQYRANFITKADIDFLAQQGFNCVRVPFHYDLFLTAAQRRARTQALRRPGNVTAYGEQLSAWYDQNQLFIDKNLDGFRHLDDVLRWCAANRMYVVLDLHAAPGGQGTDRNINDNFRPLDLWKGRDARGRAIYQDVTVRLWERLAARYKNDARVAMYDFINEPHNLDPAHGLSADNAELNALYSRLITAVRAQGDEHLLLLEGNGYGNEYTNLTPDKLAVTERRNLAYNAHRYWCPNDAAATDPNPNQVNLLQNLAAFRDRWQVPVWVGETGENSNEWFGAAVQGLAAQGIGWCHWNIKRVNSPASLLRVAPYGNILAPAGRAALLRNVQFARCTPNRDVVAALTQPNGYSAPFAPLAVPGTIAAVDYDLGRAGVAYQDDYAAQNDFANHTPWNQGGAYRNDGVDIADLRTSPASGAPSTPANDFAVTQLTAGEWLQYTVQVARPGAYRLDLRVQPAGTPGRLTLKLGADPLGSVAVGVAAGPAAWQTLSLTTAPLPAGRHTLRLCVEQPVGQLGWLRFSPANALASPGGQ